ncbi:replicative DNA helicase [Cupriavidus necator]|uniref:replicative DNA helicase n=1 Tax=Cupriavidus necator TaxID=106590 RepID=UPI00339D586E
MNLTADETNWIDAHAPHSIEAEQSVLGSLMLDGAALDSCGDLQAEHFFRDEHKAIFREIQTAVFQGRACDVVTTFERLRGKKVDIDFAYLTSLSVTSVGSASIAAHASIVRDKAQRRGLSKAGERIIQLSQKTGVRAAALVEGAQAELDALVSSPSKRDPKPINEVMTDHLAVLEERSEGRVRVIPTGLDDLDRLLAGGVRPGNVVVLGARPSVGKTALAMSIAAYVAQRSRVLLLSMEMSSNEVSDRLIAMLGQIPLDAVLKAKPDNKEMWQGVTRAITAVNELHMSVDDQPALTLLDVRQKARRIKRRGGLDLLVLDYLQLMQGRDEAEKRNYQLEEISRGVKAIAKELEIGVLELVQLNRGAEQRGGRFRMSDIRDCGGIEQDADVIGFLHRPIKDDPELGDEWKNFAWLQVEKNRQGALGDVPLSYIAEQTRFGGWFGQWPVLRSTAKRGRGLVD